MSQFHSFKTFICATFLMGSLPCLVSATKDLFPGSEEGSRGAAFYPRRTAFTRLNAARLDAALQDQAGPQVVPQARASAAPTLPGVAVDLQFETLENPHSEALPRFYDNGRPPLAPPHRTSDSSPGIQTRTITTPVRHEPHPPASPPSPPLNPFDDDAF